ncbi:probable zinc metalloprotease EGY2, chloroplastic isoform X3 [Vigna unguiculata]|uniref:probable zinc metalloprotease EGY2, chloroplastic isoform X3 n=1 Tax=Vigna unguiculata TaxID=3917 RepID=UPI0010163356|nr:probable zinc metalloprotease EGY2, chloroplastic isoform X3 [Vigna unguiculata]
MLLGRCSISLAFHLHIVGQLREVSNKVHNAELKLFLEVELGLEKEAYKNGETLPSEDSSVQSTFAPVDGEQLNEFSDANKDQNDVQSLDSDEVASGSPLPSVKPQKLDEAIKIPMETIEILRNQVFGFDTFFVISQDPYEGGVLFKGNLRGQATKSYDKISKRLKDNFGDEYKLFLLVNPEDDKPVAVVVPRTTLQPETTAVLEWFAVGAFGLVTVFTLLRLICLRQECSVTQNCFMCFIYYTDTVVYTPSLE